MESETLIQQATNNTKEQFANSPDLAQEIMHAIMNTFAAHSSMSKQALHSEKVRAGLKDVLLGPAQLYEALRDLGKWLDLTQSITPLGQACA
jgi:type I restriction enzyme R subunit